MGYKEILLEKSENKATITLDRPDKLNAYSTTMGAELLAALEEADEDPEVRVTVLTGAGKAFRAGMDMSGAGKVEKINNELLAWTMTQPDVAEGVVAYLQKRPPKWPMKVPGDLPDQMKR